MKRTNQAGFSVIEVLLTLVIVILIGSVGWFVWHSKQVSDKNLTSSDSNSVTFKNNAPTDFASCKKAVGSKLLETFPEQCVTKAGKTFTDTGGSQSTGTYLAIKEWGVKLPLTTADSGAYYTSPATYGLSQSVDIFDTSIDNLKNVNGLSCKDSGYPLLAITRVKTADVAEATDPNSTNFLVEMSAGMFKTYTFDHVYSYAGQSPHQAAPVCEDLTPAGGSFTADQSVEAAYSAVDTALSKSFTGMQAQ